MSRFEDEIRKGIHKGRVLANEPMKDHTSFQIGGPADYYVEPGSSGEVRFAIDCAREYGVPFFVIGNGTNLLVDDRGYRGMILRIGSAFEDLSIEGSAISACAGASLARVGREALNKSLTGFEFAAGIPGTVGGAVTMNAGAHDGEIRKILLSAEVLTPNGEILSLSPDQLNMSYRQSCIPERGYIVLSACFQLSKGDPEAIRERMEELAVQRRSKQPLNYPSAGSTFKRPPGYFAGKLIQDAGLKGCMIGGAQVSEKHAGFVINRGGAKASDVLELICHIQKTVEEKYGVLLEPEILFVGYDADIPAGRKAACHFHPR